MALQKIYTPGGQLQLEAYAESLIGGRPENQDSYGSRNTRLGFLLIVCDGMGGGPGGKMASSLAVNTIIATIEESGQEEDAVHVIRKAFSQANMAIIETAERQQLKGMGSTATLLLISEKSAFIAHVGDSRVYQLRGRKKVFRTFDHSMVFEMVSQGLITEEQARLSNHSNVITRALGIKPDVKVDINEVAYNSGDRFLLCTDGIHGALAEKMLVKMATAPKRSLDSITEDIATYVDNLGKQTGAGHDNLTIVLMETKSNSWRRMPSRGQHTKLVIPALTALLVVSLTMNVVQCFKADGTGSAESSMPRTSSTPIAETDSAACREDSAEVKEKPQGNPPEPTKHPATSPEEPKDSTL